MAVIDMSTRGACGLSLKIEYSHQALTEETNVSDLVC